MDEAKMIHNANQIAAFFAAYPHDEAVAGIANHLRMYWVPRMRRQIIDYAEHDGSGLNGLALEAVKRLETPAIR